MSTGILPFDELKKNCHLNTGFFETSQYTEDAQMYVTSGNHDGAGLSIGNLQYNWGQADRAQEWFKYMIDNHITIVNAAFGANTTERDEFINVVNTYTRANRITWGDSISALDGNGEKRLLQAPYKDAFGTMLISAEGKAKYYAMKDAYYWDPSYELFRHLPCKSRISLASLFDTYVNKGRYYPVNLIIADFDAIDANDTIDATEKERQKNHAINYRGNYDNAVNPTVYPPWQSDQEVFWHGDGVDDGRRGCMANLQGTYYGAPYNAETNFDMNLETATTEKQGSEPINIKLGDIAANNLYLGNTPISKLYLGANLIGGGDVTPYTSARVPKTQFRTNPASYLGIANQSAVTLDENQPLWIDVQEPFVGCRTYYTTDGTEPTEASTLYNNALTFTQNTTLKVKTISVFGIAEATKTLAVTVNVAAQAPTTTISPSATVQNNIPITITLTSSEQGATIKYIIGTGTEQTYTAPFTMNQSHANVQGTAITIKYWSIGANGTEAQKTITYDTSGAIPTKATVTATPGNNQVVLDWDDTLNTTAWTVYRSTTAGQLGAPIVSPSSQYLWQSTYTDTTAVNGQTYYYTVRSQNWSANFTDSDQKSATPTAAASNNWRYLKIEGYGQVGAETTTRIIEFEAWTGATNAMQAGGLSITYDVIDSGLKDITAIYNGTKTATSNTYPLWWLATPNANVVIDFGSVKTFTKLNYYSYSNTGDQRNNRFKILASNTNNGTDWTTIWDNQTGQLGVQPILPNGYEKVL